MRLSDLEKLPVDEIDLLALKQAGLVGELITSAKIIKSGELTRKSHGEGPDCDRRARKPRSKPLAARSPVTAIRPSLALHRRKYLANNPNLAKPVAARRVRRSGVGVLCSCCWRWSSTVLVRIFRCRVSTRTQLAKLFQARTRAASWACSTCSRVAHCRGSRFLRWGSCRTFRRRSSCS